MSAIVPWVESVLERFAAVDVRLALLALCLHVANHGLRSLAWRNVLAASYPDRRVPLLGVAASYAAGVALNAVLPARGGDAVKLGLVRAAIPSSSAATIAGGMSVLVLLDSIMGAVVVAAVAAAGLVPIVVDVPSPAAAAGWALGHPAPVAAAALAGGALAWLVGTRLRATVRRQWALARRGGAILATPARYARRVALPQTAAWACRIAVVACLLAAFGLPASPATAALVMVLAGASTLVPLTPGGAGTQQVVLAYALSGTASAAAVVSFSIGMQAAITAVNAMLGVGGMMVACRTARPLAALRHGLRLARAAA